MPYTSLNDTQTQKSIIAGKEDAYIRTIANGCKAFGYPLYIRFGGEMNIHQFEWAAKITDFIGAWRHTVEIFRSQDASNVYWVRAPYCYDDSEGPYHWTDYYLGDSYVDLVGIDVLLYSYSEAWSRPEEEIKYIYDDYASRKPIAVCEYGTNSYFLTVVDTPDAIRAAWLTEFFDTGV